MAGTVLADTLQDGAGNSTTMTNAIQGSAKAWVNFNGTSGSVAIRASYNVSSVTRSGTGTYSITFANAFVDTNYAAVMATRGSSGSGTPLLPLEHTSAGTRTTTNLPFYIIALNGVTPDADLIEIAVFR